MDVQNGLNLFSRLNDATRTGGAARFTDATRLTDALSKAGVTSGEFASVGPAGIAGLSQISPDTRAFANVLDKAIEARPEAANTASEESEKDKELRQKAQILVNQFFVGTMLKQMRNSPFKNEMFSGGKGGEAFQGMFDQRLAEHSGDRVAKSLVDALVKGLRKREDGPQQLYLDPQQQEKAREYRKSQTKQANHDAATAFTA